MQIVKQSAVALFLAVFTFAAGASSQFYQPENRTGDGRHAAQWPEDALDDG